MDEKPIREEELEPDWPKIGLLGCLVLVAVVSGLILVPIIILLWKAALR